MKKHINLYDEITADIIAQIEKGVMPWLSPWSKTEAHLISSGLGASMPLNRVSGRPYSGINVLILWAEAAKRGWRGPLQFLTYKQAAELGGHVREGEKATRIVFLGEAPKKDWTPPADGEKGESPFYRFLKKFYVFHVSQCEGIAYRPERKLNTAAMTEPEFCAFVSSTRADVRIGGTKAFYAPWGDFVGMPPLGAFAAVSDEVQGAARYKAVLCHELVHWTGSIKRLQRDLSGVHGSHKYAKEELIAEIGAAFLCAQLGIKGELRHAEYVANWLSVLKNDSKLIVQAAAQASKAADYLIALRERPIARDRALVLYMPRSTALVPIQLAA